MNFQFVQKPIFNKLTMILSSLALIGGFFFPFWRITLGAPQYPDPLGMDIWINKITSTNPYDLKNINLMNHYIGMKPIPDYISEFEIFPIVTIIIIILGIIVGLSGKKKLYLTWLILLLSCGALALYDFYLWEYDYGHNLSSEAAIQFTDGDGNPLVYQPPLIGKKVILNFTAISMPIYGAIFIFFSLLLCVAALIVPVRKKQTKFKKIKPNIFLSNTSKAATLLLLIIFNSCTIEPDPINYSHDICSYCSMTIVDRQYAAEVVTKKGKSYKYDAVECLLNDIDAFENNSIELYLVNTYDNPSLLNNADKCYYLISESLPSPMGENITAFLSADSLNIVRADNKGKVYSWNDLNVLFRN